MVFRYRVEACLDVRLEHPLVVASRSGKVTDFANGVLSTPTRPKAVRTRLKVSLEDRFKHQRQGLPGPPGQPPSESPGGGPCHQPWGWTSPEHGLDESSEL